MKKIIIIALIIWAIVAFGKSEDEKKEDEMQTTVHATESSSTTNETIERVMVENSDVSIAEKTEEATSVEENSLAEMTTIAVEVASKEELTTSVSETTSVVEKTTVVEETSENPYIFVKDLSAEVRTDYNHLDTSYIRLGNNESATVTIEATPAEVTIDDIWFYYEENVLSLVLLDEYIEDDTKYFKLSLTGNIAGIHDFAICPMWDLLERDEANIRGVSFQVQKLDNYDGQLVYVTPTGKKYHRSAACAGENGSATTRYDAEGCPYDPCGKCA